MSRPPEHGARALARHLAAGTLDRRTAIARDLEAIQDGLAEDRGGLDNCTHAERLLIETAACEALIVRAIAMWSFQQSSLIVEDNGDGPRLLGPLAKGFTSHSAQLVRTLVALGVKPDKVDRLPSLQDYISAKATNGTASAPDAAVSDDRGTTEAETSADEHSNQAGDGACRETEVR